MTTDRERADMAYQLLKDALSDDEAPTLLDRLMVAERDLAEAREVIRDLLPPSYIGADERATLFLARGGQPT